MPKEPMTNRSKGFCFIEYAEPSAAKQALATMNGFELHGRQLKVNIPMSAQPQSAAAVRPRIALLNPIMIAQQAAMSGIDPSVALLQAQMQQRQQQMQASRPTVQAGPKTRIYVGSVFYNLKTDHVREVFESFGKITSCELIPNPENGLHKGYGFIEFERQEDAQEAIDNMNGFELCSRPIKVGWASVQPTAATTTASAPAPPQPAPAAAAAAVVPTNPVPAVSFCLPLLLAISAIVEAAPTFMLPSFPTPPSPPRSPLLLEAAGGGAGYLLARRAAIARR
mmetsp:Transcript_30037/g.41864  ORF Transcript_30037/g.41864 Transcript_30037/m.41864 type:complete len:281 (-) Transcript_30037:175-1017(-)